MMSRPAAPMPVNQSASRNPRQASRQAKQNEEDVGLAPCSIDMLPEASGHHAPLASREQEDQSEE